ncbi:glutathione S-transferase family protein [Lacimicrobium alkaliphilum]|uniref:Glutathione S-transferase n=1 Tax=Lacimicrobium alkaliphilum TaxID=1526571 RepID=A0ABQ1R7D3_9ALTE|nr:glutathione S-transferase family protein [Lacimicrobium alkaliphilum]GGD61126.1 hypothetical protein GCM10011357_15540 [Lacimicrobium alkaliphilum]
MKKTKPELTLYHDWDSLMSFKVRVCLAEKELEWQSRRVILRNFEHLQPDYLKLNPAGVVPALIHNNRVVTESSVINEYLDDTFKAKSLIPPSAHEKASMRLWCKYFDEVVHPTLRPMTFELMIRQRFRDMQKHTLEQLVRAHPMPDRAQAFRKLVGTDTDIEAVIEAANRIREVIQKLATTLQQQPWLTGIHYSLADAAYMALVDRLQRLQLSCLWQEAPQVGDWLERLQARPAFKQAQPSDNLRMPSPEPHIMAQVKQRLLCDDKPPG